jgi:hypothetical protein
MTPGRRKTRRFLVLAYTAILVVQLVMLDSVLYVETELFDVPQFLFRRVLGLVLLGLPALVYKFVRKVDYANRYLPSMRESATIGISELSSLPGVIKQRAETLNDSRKKLALNNLVQLAHDMTRHNSSKYINSHSLPDEFFEKARKTFSDPHIYIAISRSGSPASEFISVFTQQQFNHASISFDSKLETIVSYNGGERVYPPGLNKEMLDFFRKSPTAKILVYSLACTAEQKEKMLNLISKINEEGSAYNILGLFVHKRKHKPNILYCTQFVLKLLDAAELTYFNVPDKKISPTDLIQLDYYRRLKFETEITFG